MLAYVFWHTRSETADRNSYDAGLRAFHTELAMNRPSGFIRSHSFHLPGGSWLGVDEGYEDWYLVESLAALEDLNKDAVTGQISAAHDHIAQLSGRGTAGLYRPIGIQPEGIADSTGLWFSKPSGLSYDSMNRRLAATNPEILNRLWQRMLTLGPTPEFCVLGRGNEALPFGWEGELVVRRTVFAG